MPRRPRAGSTTGHAAPRLIIAVYRHQVHTWFLDRLLPVCDQLLHAAAGAGQIRTDVEALTLMHGVGNLCIGAENDNRYHARQMVEVLIAGLRVTA